MSNPRILHSPAEGASSGRPVYVSIEPVAPGRPNDGPARAGRVSGGGAPLSVEEVHARRKNGTDILRAMSGGSDQKGQ